MPQIDDEHGAAADMAPALRRLEYPLSRELTVRECVQRLRGLSPEDLAQLSSKMTNEAGRRLEEVERPRELQRAVELIVCGDELRALSMTTARMREAGIGCG